MKMNDTNEHNKWNMYVQNENTWEMTNEMANWIKMKSENENGIKQVEWTWKHKCKDDKLIVPLQVILGRGEWVGLIVQMGTQYYYQPFCYYYFRTDF